MDGLTIGIGFSVLMFAALAVQYFCESPFFPYERKTSLFSTGEAKFLMAMEDAIGGKLRVFGKVRIGDVLQVRTLYNKRNWHRAYNQIHAKHFDYVLCDKKDLSVVAVVALEDKTYTAAIHRKKDILVNGACDAAGLPLIRFKLQSDYDSNDILAKIQDAVPNFERAVTPKLRQLSLATVSLIPLHADKARAIH